MQITNENLKSLILMHLTAMPVVPKGEKNVYIMQFSAISCKTIR